MTAENLLSEWSRLLAESLADAGLREVVISPGSRSTPLAWAFLNVARLRCHSVVDERSAAFFALGHGKTSGFPAAILCTSGSAAANYFPAIVEASLSHCPLIVLTADRPFELLDASAPQTIDQTKIFGTYVKRFVELGMPDQAESALGALRRKAAQTLFDAQYPEPGPVHMNFRARKPLEPTGANSSAGRELAVRIDAVLARPVTKADPPIRRPAPQVLEAIGRDSATAKRGLIVCGPTLPSAAASPAALARLATRTGFPVYAEATSQLRFGGEPYADESLVLDGLDALLRSPSFARVFDPDVVIQIGEPPVSGAWDRFVAAHPNVVRHVVAAQGWPDPHGTARTLVVADVDESLDALSHSIEQGPEGATAAWTASLARANRAAWKAVDAVLDESPGLSEGAAVRAVVTSLPGGAVLALGNSLPIRHVDAFVRGGGPRISVFGQRGASGIDGVVSAAAGVAVASARPTVLILGDLSALHDLGGFSVAASSKTPFAVVVLNNDGGRIFEQLPFASTDVGEDRLRFWTTPHGRNFGPLAELFGIVYERPKDLSDLCTVVESALRRAGCTLIEVIVPPHGARDQYGMLATRVDREIRELGSE